METASAVAHRKRFDCVPGPGRGKPPHVWAGVHKKDPEVLKLLSDQKKHPWGFRCPAPMCFYQISTTSEKDAESARSRHEATGCPWFGGGSTTLDWGAMSGSFLDPIWAQLDARMSDIMDNLTPETDAHQRAKYEARGLAISLAILMPPFFHTPDEIAREAKVRYDKRKAGEDYETHGIGRLRYKPPSSTIRDVHTSSTPAPQKHLLDEATRKGVIAALESGLFKPEQLANTYSVSVAYIKSLVQS